MEKLFLIDAYALIYRSYYALVKTPRFNSKGLNTSAVMGFVNTLHEVVSREQPTHLAVVFDCGRTFRHEMYAPYKAQREEMPEDIRQSVPIIRDILTAMRIPMYQAEGFEADDVIGTLAVAAAGEGTDTYMLTPDKDYAQLVRERVYQYRPRHGGGYETLDEKGVCEKYGVEHALQVIDLLALMGDSSDNYPGCPGVGEKTAQKLIGEYGSVEALLGHTDQLRGKMRERVETAAEDIRMSYRLATIRTDVPIALRLDEMRVREPDAEAVEKIFDELEFKTLAKKILKKSEKTVKSPDFTPSFFAEFATEEADAPKNEKNQTAKTLAHEYILVDNEAFMEEISKILVKNQVVSLDTETTSTQAIDAELVGLSFSVEPHKAYYVPVPAEREAAQRVVEIFRPVYENCQIMKVGQNLKYDYQVLRRYGVTLAAPMFDTMLAHYLIQPELRHNMDFMAETLLGYQTIHIDELIGPRGKGQKNMRDLSPADITEYAAEDADITLQLKNILEPQLKEVGAERLFWDIEMPLMPVLAEMELAGVRIDTAALSDTASDLRTRMAEYERQIYEEAGETFNISSPKQVGDILFGKMKIIEKPKKTKTGQYVTSEEVLQQVKGRAPIVEHILCYRGLKKLLGTYVEALPLLVNPHTGHIHTSFNQAVTATGRLSSSDPNLQNIPIRDDDGKEIRRCFIPEPGCLWFSADYSQIELRIMAHLSGDEHMCDAFRSGEDIHAATAARIWHKEPTEVTPAERKQAKQANFGIIYGITSYGLSQRMGITPGEGKTLIEDYFHTFPGVEQYMEKAKEQCRERGYAETLYGRRRYLPDILSRNATVRGFAERNAINAPIQGTEADIIKVAMIRIARRFRSEGLRSQMILQVHDELNFSVVPEERERVERIVMEEMERACPLSVPLTADAGWGGNWLEAH